MPRVLIQKGHHAPRDPNHERETGASGEQECVGRIGDELARLLAADARFVVRVCPGLIPDDVRSGAWPVDAFLSLHCDGSVDPLRRGWGVGYPTGGVNVRLANLIADEFRKIPHPATQLRDNYTTNMSGYYGWSRVPTDGPEVLVEHDFSSSPDGRRWLLDNAARLAQAHYSALLRFFALPPADNVGRLAVLRAWILARVAEGWTWARVKASHNWAEFKRRGGR